MTLRPTSLALALLTLAPPAAALAEEPKGDRRTDQTNYSFDDDLVNGDTTRPNVEVLHVRKRGERESLIRARTHFIPELLETAQDL